MARDDFLTHITQYDPNQIYTDGATDQDGHSVNFRCNVPTHWAATINEIVQSADWPEYSTTQSFLRDALYHRINWVETQTDRGKIDAVRQLRAIESVKTALARHAYFRRAFEAMLEEIEESFRSASLHPDREVLLSLIEELEDSISEFPERLQDKLHDELDYWKRRVS